MLEDAPFHRLANESQMGLFQHAGFWQCMDTFKEAQALNGMWERGDAPWKVWD
jgi:glucose-1-phosphate cytidylyltransferase